MNISCPKISKLECITILRKLEQFIKALSPITRNCSGNSTVVIFVSLKAYVCIAFTVVGISISRIEVFEKVLESITSNPSGRITLLKLRHPLNTPALIFLTLTGIITSLRDSHWEKALPPISSKLFGNFTLFILLHPAKAAAPIYLHPSSKITSSMYSHFSKTRFHIPTTVFPPIFEGIIMCLSLNPLYPTIMHPSLSSSTLNLLMSVAALLTVCLITLFPQFGHILNVLCNEK